MCHLRHGVAVEPLILAKEEIESISSVTQGRQQAIIRLSEIPEPQISVRVYCKDESWRITVFQICSL